MSTNIPLRALAYCLLLLVPGVFYSACCHTLKPLPSSSPRHLQGQPAARVVLVVLDGVRVQEFFEGGRYLRKKYKKEKARKRLLPFLWGELAPSKNTLILGDTQKPQGVACLVNNPYHASLPAYADILSGVRQHRVRNNRFRAQPGCSAVSDHLVREGRDSRDFAFFSSWQHIERVVSRDYRHRFYIDAGFKGHSPKPVWKNARFDRHLQEDLMRYLKHTEHKPAFISVVFNDTDEWGHIGSYRNYIQALKEQDGYIKEIYSHLESQAFSRGRTAYIITTDHGRGLRKEWRKHGDVPGAEKIWLLFHAPLRLGLSAEQRLWVENKLRQNCSHTTIGKLIYWLLSSKRSKAPPHDPE